MRKAKITLAPRPSKPPKADEPLTPVYAIQRKGKLYEVTSSNLLEIQFPKKRLRKVAALLK